MKDLFDSLVRTWVPIIVGALVSWLVTPGVEVSGEVQAALLVTLTAVLQGFYYSIARLLETRFPKFGVLLGKPTAPTYAGSPSALTSQYESRSEEDAPLGT